MTALSNSDLEHLRTAINLAASAESRGNRAFGAVIVSADGAVLASAENTTIVDSDSAAHAEINAIRLVCRAGEQARLVGATIYASAEPCAMCAGAIVRFGLRRVVYGNEVDKTLTAQSQPAAVVHVSSRAIAALAPHDIAVIGPCEVSR